MALCAAIVGAFLLNNFSALATETPSAKEIAKRASISRKLDGSEAVSKMEIYNAKGEKRVRKIAMVTKLVDKGETEKRLIRFLSPADVKGTGLLTYDYERENDDMWLYLPALRKTRRLISKEKSKSFMGSEFSYGDMNTPILENFNYRILKNEERNGTDCYVIEVLPKNDDIAEEDGYCKKVIWVGKKDYVIRKAMYYDLEDNLLKEMTAKNIKLVDTKKKRYRAMYMEMVNKQNGRRSVFTTEKIQFNPETKDEYFTTRYLERP
ncbi:MAG: outer membrane lipoprotein-sorting protein [Proteobacteria bacterium]|nr:outer membrane lipoprotein-sorting protein [Pseudomonadota bacterium]